MLSRLLPCCIIGLGMGGQVWLLFERGPFVSEKRQVEGKRFTTASLSAEGRDFIGRFDAFPFGKGVYAPGRELLNYVEKGTVRIDQRSYFFRLQKEFPLGLRTWPRLAMILKIGQTGMLRIREDGWVKEILLTPQHPAPGQELGYEVLDFAGSLCGPRKYCGLLVFLRKQKGEIRQDELESIGRRFCEIDSTLEYLIYARPDSWFIEQPQFPFLYAFDNGYALPDPKTWQPDRDEWSVRVSCAAGGAGKLVEKNNRFEERQ